MSGSIRAASSAGSPSANLATGLFQGFPISSSSSRTPVAEAAGARTQLTGVVAAAAVGVVLVLGTGLLEKIPTAALAAVVIAAVLRLIDVPAFRWLLRVNRGDFALAVASFVGVLVLGILPGVGFAVALSVIAVLERAWHPYTAVLGRVAALKGYHDTMRHPEGAQVPAAPLPFRRAAVLRERRGVQGRSPPGAGGGATRRLDGRRRGRADHRRRFHRCRGARPRSMPSSSDRESSSPSQSSRAPSRTSSGATAWWSRSRERRFYPTIGLAVRAHVEEHGIDWHDWEDRGEDR